MGKPALSLGMTLGVALIGFGGLHYSPEVGAANGWGGYNMPAKRIYFRPVAQRMNRSQVTSTRWRPQPGQSMPRYGYPQAGGHANDAASYRTQVVTAVEAVPAAGAGRSMSGGPSQAFRPGGTQSTPAEDMSRAERATRDALHQQFRPAVNVRRPSYEELQAKTSYRGYPGSVYGTYARNMAVAPVYYGTHWRNW